MRQHRKGASSGKRLLQYLKEGNFVNQQNSTRHTPFDFKIRALRKIWYTYSVHMRKSRFIRVACIAGVNREE